MKKKLFHVIFQLQAFETKSIQIPCHKLKIPFTDIFFLIILLKFSPQELQFYYTENGNIFL